MENPRRRPESKIIDHLIFFFLCDETIFFESEACRLNLKFNEQEICVANSWFELLFVVYMIAILTFSEANSLMIPKDYSGSGIRVVSTGNLLIHMALSI